MNKQAILDRLREMLFDGGVLTYEEIMEEMDKILTAQERENAPPIEVTNDQAILDWSDEHSHFTYQDGLVLNV